MFNFPVISITRCTVDVKSWIASHNLLLNESKTDVVVISAVHNHKHVQPPVDVSLRLRHCSTVGEPAAKHTPTDYRLPLAVGIKGSRCSMSFSSAE